MLTLDQVFELLDEGNTEVLASSDWGLNQSLQLHAIDINPSYIRFMTEPSQRTILKALEIDGLLLEYIVIQTQIAVNVAYKQNPKSIIFINESRFKAHLQK